MDNFLKNSLAGSSACLVATSLLNPLEVIKIQIQTGQGNGNMIQTGLRLFKSEGAWYGLMQPGLLASCSRELFYSSLRFSIYPNLRNLFRSDTNHYLGLGAFGEKFGAGLIAGAVGSSLANPADLLKIRMQLEPGKMDRDGRYLRGPRQGQFKVYKSTAQVFKDVLRTEGVRGLYRGVSATCLRSSLLTAGQLSSYDHSKQLLKASGLLSEGLPLHLTCSVVSGLVAATVCAPADRIKTAMMVGKSDNLTFKRAMLQVRFRVFRVVVVIAHLFTLVGSRF